MGKQIALRKWINIVGKEKLQTFQDFFASNNKVTISILNTKGDNLLVQSRGCLLCHELWDRKNSPCHQEHETARKTVEEQGKMEVFTCNMGLTFFLCPLFSGDKIIGFGYGGCVACEHSPIPEETRSKYNITVMTQQELLQIGKFYDSIASLLNVDYKDLYLNDAEGNGEGTRVNDPRLTEREMQVTELICKGHSNKEIAEELFISEKTVKTHVSSILTKLNVNDRTQIVVLYSNLKNARRGAV